MRRSSLRYCASLLAEASAAGKSASTARLCMGLPSAVANTRSAVSLLPAAARSPAACRAFSSVTIDVDGDYDSSSSSEGGSDVYPSAEADGNAYSLQSSVVAIDAQAPSFSCNAVVDGEIKWLNAEDYEGRYVVLFFYPLDWTYVCPTEIIAFSEAAAEFEAKGCSVIGASCDSAETHMAWIRSPRHTGGLGKMAIPLLADVNRRVSKSYGVLNASNIPNRGIFLISPQGVVKAMQILNNDVGRSVDEAMRLLDAFQLVAEHGVVCPANWKPGSRAMSADVDESLEYFESVNPAEGQAGGAAEAADESADFGQAIHTIASEAEYEALVSSGKPIVVDFMAGWCGKCRMISPAVETLQDAHPDITFVKVDTSQEGVKALGERLGVEALPAFKFYFDGEEALPGVIGYKKRPLQNSVAKLQKLATSPP